jgi:hypothetical protein
MSPRIAAVLLVGGVFYACDGSPTAAAPARLTVTVSPNPMRSPSGPGSSLLWSLEIKASGSGSVLLQRGYARLVDSAGRIVGSNIELWSRAAGCESCKTDIRIDDGATRTFDDKPIVYVGGEPPAKFVYTLSFTDDLGDGSVTVEVPVHRFAQASGSSGELERRSALTMNRWGAGPM